MKMKYMRYEEDSTLLAGDLKALTVYTGIAFHNH